MNHSISAIAFILFTITIARPLAAQSAPGGPFRAGTAEKTPVLDGRDSNGKPPRTLRPDRRDANPPPMLGPIRRAPTPPPSLGPARRDANPLGTIKQPRSNPSWIRRALKDTYDYQPDPPDASGPIFNAVDDALSGPEKSLKFLKPSVTGYTGTQKRLARDLRTGLATNLKDGARRIRWFSVVDPITNTIRILGAVAGGDAVGVAQEGSGWLASSLSAMAGAKAGGLLGMKMGAASGTPHGVLAGGVVGTFVGAMGGSFLYEMRGKPVIDYVADRVAARNGMETIDALLNLYRGRIQQANQLLDAGQRDEATTLARQVISGMKGSVSSVMLELGRSSEALALEQSAVAVLVRAAQTPRNPGPTPEELTAKNEDARRQEAVERAQTALALGGNMAAQKQYGDALQMVRRSLELAPLLRAAGRGDLLSALETLHAQLNAVVAQSNRPRITILSGTGPWISGQRQGTVTVTIDLARQTFTGSLNASRRGQYGTTVYTGAFTGRYTGNESGGTINGGGTVQMRTGNSASSYYYQITGQQQNYLVNGNATNAGDSFPFGVTLRQVK